MRRQVLERQNVVGGQADDRVRRDGARQIAQRAHDRQQLIHRAVVRNDDDDRPRCRAMQQCVEEGFARRSESRDTSPPRATLYPGYRTRKGGRLFHVREEFANEREDHCLFSLPANQEPVASSQLSVARASCKNLQVEGAYWLLFRQNSKCSRSPGTVTGPRTRLYPGLLMCCRSKAKNAPRQMCAV